jgi:hypothetical protein
MGASKQDIPGLGVHACWPAGRSVHWGAAQPDVPFVAHHHPAHHLDSEYWSCPVHDM